MNKEGKTIAVEEEKEEGCDRYEDIESDAIFDILSSENIDVDSLRENIEFLTFSNSFEPDALRMLEISDDLLSQLQRGESLHVRGELSENAHLCGRDSSFSVVGSQLSSTLLIVEKHPVQMEQRTSVSFAELKGSAIIGQPSSLLQLTFPCVNCIRRVKQFLGNRPFRGMEFEAQQPLNVENITMERLYSEIPSSNHEICAALERLFSCNIGESIRLLDFGYIEKITATIMRFIEENSWSWKAVCQQDVMKELSDLEPLPVLERWFELFTTTSETDPNLRTLDEEKFCRLYAEMLLRRAKKFSLEDFKNIWQESVPDGMRTSFDQLAGVAIVRADQNPAFIEYLPQFDLPDEATLRLKALFARKEQWSFPEIKPYLRDLFAESSQLYEFLEKQCRSLTENGSTFYMRKF